MIGPRNKNSIGRLANQRTKVLWLPWSQTVARECQEYEDLAFDKLLELIETRLETQIPY